MQIKEINPISFLYFETEAGTRELQEYVRRVPRALHLEAAKLGIDVTGPVYWNYFNLSGDQERPFTLQVSIPVAELVGNYGGDFQFRRAEPFKCLATYHYGTWRDMSKTYRKLQEYIHSHQLKTVPVNREIYINCDYLNPDGNFTEIQIGLQ